MITLACIDCSFAIRTLGDENEEQMIYRDAESGGMQCPKCKRPMDLHESVSGLASKVLETHELSPTEAYAACNGLGLPDEQECGPLSVRLAFNSPVTKVNARLLRGSNRSIVDSIEFASGDVLYLGSSGYGAIAYRLTHAK